MQEKIEEHQLKNEILAKENAMLETVGHDTEKKLNTTVRKLDTLMIKAHDNQNSKK